MGYLYLRGATAVVAGLLLVVVIGDLVLPHVPVSRMLSQLGESQAVAPVAEVAGDLVVSKEIPIETLGEVTVEKEAAKRALPVEAAVEESVAPPMGTPLPPAESLEMAPPLPPVPDAELEAAGAAAEEPMAFRAPNSEQVSETLPLVSGETSVEPQGPMATDVPTPLPTPSATATVETVSQPVSPTVEVEARLPLSPTVLAPPVADVEAPEPWPRGAADLRATLRVVEIGLASLLSLLVGGLLLARARRS
jgi:hypothetical protein